jgi:hypothetical protein
MISKYDQLPPGIMRLAAVLAEIAKNEVHDVPTSDSVSTNDSELKE